MLIVYIILEKEGRLEENWMEPSMAGLWMDWGPGGTHPSTSSLNIQPATNSPFPVGKKIYILILPSLFIF